VAIIQAPQPFTLCARQFRRFPGPSTAVVRRRSTMKSTKPRALGGRPWRLGYTAKIASTSAPHRLRHSRTRVPLSARYSAWEAPSRLGEHETGAAAGPATFSSLDGPLQRLRARQSNNRYRKPYRLPGACLHPARASLSAAFPVRGTCPWALRNRGRQGRVVERSGPTNLADRRPYAMTPRFAAPQ